MCGQYCCNVDSQVRLRRLVSSLSVEDSLVYEKVKSAILRVYELVPEAYRQRFRGLRKTAGQTFVDFAREKEILFDRWSSACRAEDIASVRELMLLEEFSVLLFTRTNRKSRRCNRLLLQRMSSLSHTKVFFINLKLPLTVFPLRSPVTHMFLLLVCRLQVLSWKKNVVSVTSLVTLLRNACC